jgi:hypothetical protein
LFKKRSLANRWELLVRYKTFRIKNFKGIKDTTVSLETIAGAAVFAFVGLNESGKTTILEAIHSFSPDSATSELLGGDEESGVPYKDRVPRHLISSFTGNVSVEATLLATAEDKERITNYLLLKDIVIDPASIPDEIIFDRYQRFENGDFKTALFALRSKVKVKGKRQRAWREPSVAERIAIREAIYGFTPDIAYFPTFVFDFPQAIFLTDRGGVVDKFYRSVGAVRNAVGIRCGAFSGNMKVSFQAARSIG